MLGRFLEVGIATQDIRASVEFYERLGFTQARTGDVWTHPYGVLTDGRVCLGLHQTRLDSPALTFVRPGIAGHLGALERAGIELTTAEVGGELFNQVGFHDPAGQAVRLLEARTFSPPDRSALETSRCGEFGWLSLPAADFDAVRGFWERLGLLCAGEDTQPFDRMSLAGGGLELAWHRPGFSAQPLLTFHAADMPARIARLRELGVGPLRPPPRGLDPEANAVLAAPEGSALLLYQDGRECSLEVQRS